MSTQAEKAARFVALHLQCLITPNPWDLGSARLLEAMRIQAPASSSAGLAWSRGGAAAYAGGSAAVKTRSASFSFLNKGLATRARPC
jgi:2-methylisocitrate lyase-like PEP mutase family enzyme